MSPSTNMLVLLGLVLVASNLACAQTTSTEASTTTTYTLSTTTTTPVTTTTVPTTTTPGTNTTAPVNATTVPTTTTPGTTTTVPTATTPGTTTTVPTATTPGTTTTVPTTTTPGTNTTAPVNATTVPTTTTPGTNTTAPVTTTTALANANATTDDPSNDSTITSAVSPTNNITNSISPMIGENTTSTSTKTSSSAKTTGNPTPSMDCDEPPSIDHGSVTPEKKSHAKGSEVTYQCDEDYVLSCSSTTAVCSLGNWEFGDCLPSCQNRNLEPGSSIMNPYLIPVVAIVAGVVGLALILLFIGCLCFHWYDCFKRKDSPPKHKSITDLPTNGDRSTKVVSMFQLNENEGFRKNDEGFKADPNLFVVDERASTVGSATKATTSDSEQAMLGESVDSNAPTNAASTDTQESKSAESASKDTNVGAANVEVSVM